MRRPIPIVILTAAMLLLAGCRATGGGAASESAAAETVTVEAAETDAGTSLVGPDGLTLYVFTQDTEGASTCTGDCAAAWPPFTVDAAARVEPGDGVSGELGTIVRDDGTTQVTLEGMPLYFYAEDAAPGDAAGEGVGGVWFIAAPDGAPAGDGEAEPSEDEMGGSDDDASPTDNPADYDY